MSWNTFKSIYKAEMAKPDGDPAKGLSDGYHAAIITSLANTTGPVIGNKLLMFAQLKLCFNSFGIIPFSRGLDLSLISYWAGGKSGLGAIAFFPGLTGIFLESKGKEAKNTDEFLDLCILAFNVHLKQIAFAQGLVFNYGYTVLP